MIESIECFIVICDVCKTTYENPSSGFSVWTDKGYAESDAEEHGWHITEEKKCYCDECHYFDDNDNLIIKEEK